LGAFPHAQAGFAELRPLHFPPLAHRELRTEPAPLKRGGAASPFVTERGTSDQRQRKVINVHAKGKGTVKFFNETKGYGFFTRDDGSGDVFVHRTDLPAGAGLLYEGRAVSFDIEQTTRGLRAINVALATE
jgi:CspA family cold shock protein